MDGELFPRSFLTGWIQSLLDLRLIYLDWTKMSDPDDREKRSIENDFFCCIKEVTDLKLNETLKTVNLWCFNPGFIFSKINQNLKLRSIILTSGTLAPLDSFGDELEAKFPIKLINSHVISPSQAHLATILQGRNEDFLITYKTRENNSMI